MFKGNMTSKQKEIYRFMIMMIFVGFAVFITSYYNLVRSYNSTMLALSYDYGFTSRALLGWMYHLLDKILPVDMINYSMVLLFACVVTVLFFFLLYIFAFLCLKRCDEKYIKPCEYLILFMMIFTISTYSSGYNFFRVDIFMIAVSMIGAILIVYEKAEWLAIVLSALGVMFHQGYVFMYFNIILILLFYKFLVANNKNKRIKYLVIFTLSFCVGAALFLYFEFFSRSNGYAIYDQILAEARLLSNGGAYHTGLLEHEVLGIDLGDSEAEFKETNRKQMLVGVLLFLPYLSIFKNFFRDLIKTAKTNLDKFKYVVVLIGSLTMLPDFLLKVDYGRWYMAVILYYLVVILALVMMKDEHICNQLNNTFSWIASKPWSFLLVIYPILLIPLCDVDISAIVQRIATEIF